MGAGQSKEEQLYRHLTYGNIDGIRALRSQGAGLEFVDQEGRTPLILACLRPDLLNAARVLIELGANVNAYRPGTNAGTPLHHAAKTGLEQTVILLLSFGANPFIMNDDCRTPLDLARERGHNNVVRAIEGRIALFGGWLRESFAPNFLEAFASQFMLRKVWTVVVPRDAQSPTRPVKFELAIYTDYLIPKPRTVIPLWKCHFEEPNLNLADPSVVVIEKTTKTRHKFLAGKEGDKIQLNQFYNACRGLVMVNNVPVAPIAGPIPNAPAMVPALTYSNHPQASAMVPAPTFSNDPQASAPVAPPPAKITSVDQEDIELAMAINASIQTAMAEGVPDVHPAAQSSSDYNGWGGSSDAGTAYGGWDVPLSKTGGHSHPGSSSSSQTAPPAPKITPELPSAPLLASEATAPPQSAVHYPSIDNTPLNLSFQSTGSTSESTAAVTPKPEASSSSNATSGTCVICLDAPAEAACIPCGHVAGCMSCLREIEEKKWGCPVCRAKIDQVVKLYTV